MSIEMKCLAVIQWPVRDLEKSLAWYQEVLGFTLRFPFTPGDNEAWLALGYAGFGLIRSENPPQLAFTDTKGVRQPLVTFQVDNIQEVYQTVQGRGIRTSEMRYKPGGGYSFTLYDLDGHPVDLWGGWPKED